MLCQFVMSLDTYEALYGEVFQKFVVQESTSIDYFPFGPTRAKCRNLGWYSP